MTNDYISREDVLKGQKTGTFANGICFEAKRCVPVEYIESLEPADVEPVAYGRWIKYTGMGKEQWMCSECSAEEKNPKIARYCYHCGAKMDR